MWPHHIAQSLHMATVSCMGLGTRHAHPYINTACIYTFPRVYWTCTGVFITLFCTFEPSTPCCVAGFVLRILALCYELFVYSAVVWWALQGCQSCNMDFVVANSCHQPYNCSNELSYLSVYSCSYVKPDFSIWLYTIVYSWWCMWSLCCNYIKCISCCFTI